MIKHLLALAFIGACRSTSVPPFGDLLTRIAGPLPSDSAVLARLDAAHPCQSSLPDVRGVDSLAPRARCIVASTALAAIEEHRGAPEVFAGLSFSLAKVTCTIIRQEAYRNARTGKVDAGRWTVELLADDQPSLAVEIDRLTGDAQAFRIPSEFGFTAREICARAT